MKRKVVITGLGALTALGEGARVLWEAASQGRSGIDRLDFGRNSAADWHPAGGCYRDFLPEKFVPQRKALKVMARDIQLAIAGASLALTDAGLDLAAVDHRRFGVIAGSGVLNQEVDELAPSVYGSMTAEDRLDLKKFGEAGLPALFPLWLLKYLPNMPACHISILFDLQGINNTITTGASAGLGAVGEAFRIIEYGDAEIMLAGGAESKVNPMGLSRYGLLGMLADLSGPDPEKIYKPFDRAAGGFVVGEGAGFLVLEELEHAKKRNARIYAELAGFGCSDEQGKDAAMALALQEAGLAPEDIPYIQAAGLGIKEEDRKEAEAIGRVFGRRADTLCVTGSKAVTGFAGFASGAIDLVLSTLTLAEQTVPPLLNFTAPEKDWGFKIVKDRSVKRAMDFAMTNAFGLGAPSAAMVTKRYREK